MSKEFEVLQDALELLAVATFITPKLQAKRTDVINTGLKLLAKKPAQQEPVAIVAVDGVGQIQVGWITKPQHNDKLYTSPPQRTWVGLTDVQIGQVLDDPNIAEAHQGHWRVLPFAFARAIEAKLKEKNT